MAQPPSSGTELSKVTGFAQALGMVRSVGRFAPDTRIVEPRPSPDLPAARLSAPALHIAGMAKTERAMPPTCPSASCAFLVHYPRLRPRPILRRIASLDACLAQALGRVCDFGRSTISTGVKILCPTFKRRSFRRMVASVFACRHPLKIGWVVVVLDLIFVVDVLARHGVRNDAVLGPPGTVRHFNMHIPFLVRVTRADWFSRRRMTCHCGVSGGY